MGRPAGGRRSSLMSSQDLLSLGRFLSCDNRIYRNVRLVSRRPDRMCIASAACGRQVSRLAWVSDAPAVEIRGLVKRYGRVTAVDGLSMRAERGEMTALLGPNGAGKTTTVEVCEGYRRADAGTVRVLGLDPMRDA